MKKIKNKKTLIYILILLISEIIFFRNILFTSGLIGTRLDARYTNVIVEHIFRFISGKDKIFEMQSFFPYIEWGYKSSDLLLVNGIFHSLFRFCGLDIYSSYKFALVMIHTLGTFSMFYLLNKTLNIKSTWCVIGTYIFSFSNIYAIKMYHTQLITFSLLPILVILLINYFYNINNRKRRSIFMFSLITMMAVIVYTSWYMLYFFCLFIALFLVVTFIYCCINKYNILKKVDLVNTLIVDLFIYLIYGIIVLIPFVYIYLPALISNGDSWEWDYICEYVPTLFDLFNYSWDSLLFGHFFTYDPLDTTEVLGGISIPVIILFFVSLYYVIKNKAKNAINIELLVAVTCIVLFIISLKIDNTNYSLWYFIYKFLPGGSAIRAIGRVWLFLLLPISIFISFVCHKYFKLKTDKITMLASIITLVIVMIFEARSEGVYSKWDSDTEIFVMNTIGENIPKDCVVFFIYNSSDEFDDGDVSESHNVDAMAMAQQYGLFTINGYTGVFPKNANNLLFVYNDNYLRYVINWVIDSDLMDYGMEYIYGYDIYENNWTKINLK